MNTKLNETTHFIKSRIGSRAPKIGIVLGSGLGEFATKIEDKIEFSFQEIPNFHPTTIKGHTGKLIIGKIGETEVAVFQGRYHYYEGHPIQDVILPVRVMAKLGIHALILTNASGGINSNYNPGDLVCITDHLNLTGTNPLIGPNNEELGVRFPDMTESYNKELNTILFDSAKEIEIELKAGVYAGLVGPSYETPAEIKMLGILGADLVGMSTVFESITANHAGLQVCGISCITNLAAGISKEKLSHDDVKDVANKAMHNFTSLLELAVSKIGKIK